MDVNAVKEWAGDALLMFGDDGMRTGEGFLGVSIESTRTWIHGCDLVDGAGIAKRVHVHSWLVHPSHPCLDYLARNHPLLCPAAWRTQLRSCKLHAYLHPVRFIAHVASVGGSRERNSDGTS